MTKIDRKIVKYQVQKPEAQPQPVDKPPADKPSEPKPAQASRVLMTCLARRSASGMRTWTSTHWPSHACAGPNE